ncbi:MAG TPA: hypothetical protein VFA27_07075 [Vicinamibacterales bacterium]|nr:hypothetical protein [Vicinamibacterales bacterium]
MLLKGFEFEGRPVSLLSPAQGIFKPAILNVPLSITTTAPSERKRRPYDDQVGPDGLLRYRYRGTDIQQPDNVGLREAMVRRVPLVYFFGIVPGRSGYNQP